MEQKNMTNPTPSEGVLYFLDWNEPVSYSRKDDGTILRNCEEDNWPGGIGEDQPNGVFLVFVGTIHQNTDDWTEEQCEAAEISIEAMKYSAWWDGDFREATDEEIADVFCPQLRARLATCEGEKNAAYAERNRVVAWAALLSHQLGDVVRVTKTVIEGWDPAWHNCVFVETPNGQASWHFHDTESHLFFGLTHMPHVWDGHSTEEKYARLQNLMLTRPLSKKS
jgi:hypothetical protein